jgi:hypothetical protein
MSILAHYRYRNPLDILIEQESRTCKGCRYEFKAAAFGAMVAICTYQNAQGKRRQHGKRCRHYCERTVDVKAVAIVAKAAQITAVERVGQAPMANVVEQSAEASAEQGAANKVEAKIFARKRITLASLKRKAAERNTECNVEGSAHGQF